MKNLFTKIGLLKKSIFGRKRQRKSMNKKFLLSKQGISMNFTTWKPSSKKIKRSWLKNINIISDAFAKQKKSQLSRSSFNIKLEFRS